MIPEWFQMSLRHLATYSNKIFIFLKRAVSNRAKRRCIRGRSNCSRALSRKRPWTTVYIIFSNNVKNHSKSNWHISYTGFSSALYIAAYSGLFLYSFMHEQLYICYTLIYIIIYAIDDVYKQTAYIDICI